MAIVVPVVRLAPLFAERRTLRAVVDAVLEGRFGVARADDADRPLVARLDVGCYSIFGGAASATDALELARTIPTPRELVFPDDESWRKMLHDVHPGLVDRSMRSFDASALDAKRLSSLTASKPDGFEIRRIDAGLAARLGPDVEPHGMQVFDTPETFATSGIGYCALAGEVVACAATSYTVCAGAIELAIATHPGHRRRGLALVVAATLILECLERGVAPHWNAANPVSQHLAIALGYEPAETCEVLVATRHVVA